MNASDRTFPQKNNRDGVAMDSRTDTVEEGDSEEDAEPVKVLEEAASFDEMMVWGHEAVPEGDDPYVKGVEEWIAFAEAVSESAFSWRMHSLQVHVILHVRYST